MIWDRMRYQAKEYWKITMGAVKEWQNDQASHKAAALAYYTTFSLAPVLVLAIAVAGLFGGREAASGLVMNQIQDLIGVEGRVFVQSMIENAAVQSTGITATIIGSITLIFGAMGAFVQLQNALNNIWNVEAKPVQRWTTRLKDLILTRLFSFSMVVGIGFLLLVSLVVNAAISAIGELFAGIPVLSEIFLQVLNLIVSFGIITLLFAMLFKFVPDVRIKWRHVWVGAMITALLFSLGKMLIGLYLGRSSVGSTFGAAGSLALIMIWIYYSSQIVFFGAEFCQVYSRYKQRPPGPTEHAVKKPKV